MFPLRARSGLLVIAALATLFAPRDALAQDAPPPEPEVDFAACFTAHAQAQSLRLEGALLGTREALEICSSQACPEMVRVECARWADEIRGEVPNVRFSAQRGSETIADVRVYVDERLIAESPDPEVTYELDPGVYTVRFEHPIHGSTEVPAVVRRGERGRLIVGRFAVPIVREAPDDTVRDRIVEPAPRPFVVPESAWVMGASSLALFAGAAALGIAVLVERQDALRTCAPFCAPALVDRLRAELIASDVLLGAATVGAITAVVLLFVDQPSPPTARSVGAGLSPNGVWWW